MFLKIKNFITLPQRQFTQLSQTFFKKQQPLIKKKIKGLKNSSGRNSLGKITVRHKGGGHKKKYRTLSFF